MYLLRKFYLITAVIASSILQPGLEVAPFTKEMYNFKATVFDDSCRHIYCSGALIRSDIVITNARCTNKKPSEYLVYFNVSPNPENIPREGAWYEVKAVLQHEKYSAIDESASINDLGLFKLKQEVSDIEPIGLGNANSSPHTSVGILTGWDRFSSGFNVADINLSRVNFNIKSNQKCKSIYQAYLRSKFQRLTTSRFFSLSRFDTNQLICANSNGSNSIIYHQDGEPFFIKSHGQYKLAGIVSFIVESLEQPENIIESHFVMTNIGAHTGFIDKSISSMMVDR